MTSLGHAHPAVAEAVAEQARTLLHVSNLFGNAVGPEVAVTLDRLVGRGPERAGRAGVLHQLGGRGQRVRAQAGPQVGRPGPPRGGEHVGRVPRPDPGHAARHRPAREARPVRPAARGLRARRLRRPRRPRRGVRPGAGRGGAPRAHPGRGRRDRPVVGLPRRRARAVHRARHPAHGGRDPDRPGPHRAGGSPSSTPGSSPTW